MKKGIFTGSFDPFTIGHLDIVKRALPLFDELTICIGFNELKHYDEPVEERMEKHEDKIWISVDGHGMPGFFGLRKENDR